jgi:hypothetical protein
MIETIKVCIDPSISRKILLIGSRKYNLNVSNWEIRLEKRLNSGVLVMKIR